MPLGSVEQAIQDIRAGKLVVVVDDETREDEGDLVAAAETVTPAMINFMSKHGRGLICLALTAERCRALDLPQMVEQNTASLATAYTASVDAHTRFGVPNGEWTVIGYRNDVDDAEHVALVYGDVKAPGAVLARMHSRCLTGDVFHSARCDCGWQLETAMQIIAEAGRGVVVYLDQEGRGI